MKTSTNTWALYFGTRMVAERQATEAAYADARKLNPEFVRLHGSEAISGYRLSIWGPRGGNIEYMQPL